MRLSEQGRTREVELYKESHALLIGVSDYTAGWPSLSGVKKDVVEVGAALRRQGFEVETVENPDAAQLRAAYEGFIRRHGGKADARLLLYFSGHGHTLRLGWGGDMGYIVPADAPNPNRDLEGFKGKALDMQQIEVYAKRIEAKHALFVFDSCFSGSIFDMKRAVPENISYKTTQAVRQFITSGRADEEVPNESVFRAQFVEGLGGEADRNRDGYVTGAELGEFLEEKVINYSKGTQHPQYGKIRNPLLDKGDFVFPLAPQQQPSQTGMSAPPSRTPAPTVVVPDFSADDLLFAAEARRRLREAAVGAFGLMERVDADADIAARDKAARWDEYVEKFAAADHELAFARDRARHWRDWKPPTPSPRPTDTPRPTSPPRPTQAATPGTARPQPGDSPSRPATGAVRAVDLGGGVSMNLVYIRGGTFTMGSEKAEQDQAVRDGYRREWVDWESPQTRVTLTEDFWMGETEVTQAQWKTVMGSGNNPSHFKGDAQPVENVSWNDIMGSQSSGRAVAQPGSFMARLSERVSGLSFTLPTEAQWEYACRAGTTTPFHFGATISTDQANYDGNYTYGSGRKGVYRQKTTSVKSFPSNAWGLYDMHGNVWEWCSDWFADKLPGGSVTNPSGPGSGGSRVLRGGSWGRSPGTCRSANRNRVTPTLTYGDGGFRVVSVASRP